MPPDASATVAVNLGWQLTEIAFQGQPRGHRTRPARRDLPTLSDLERWEVTEIGVRAVEAGIHQLCPTWEAAGFDAPSTKPLRDALRAEGAGPLKQASFELHYEVIGLLHAADFTAGEAYDLGRAHAYTTLKPDDAASLREQFGFFRLETLQGWLADLASALPPHAARSVAVSLDVWQRVIPEPSSDDGQHPTEAPAERRASRATAAPEPTVEMPAELRRLLHRQGRLWRAVLSGEKDGRDMLSTRHYVDAGLRLLATTGRLIGRFFDKPRVILATGLLVIPPLAAVVLLLTLDHQVATKVTGSLLAVATALGISWAGVRATLGRALARAEQPLWQAELDTAIAEAITVLPSDEGRLRQLFGFTRAGAGAPGKLASAATVAAERLPRGPDAP